VVECFSTCLGLCLGLDRHFVSFVDWPPSSRGGALDER
jgi:hypothetical protein